MSALSSRALLLGILLCLQVCCAGAAVREDDVSVRVDDGVAKNARALLRASLELHGNPRLQRPLQLTFRGKHADLGHYARPFELRDYESVQHLLLHPDSRVERHGELSRESDRYTAHVDVSKSRLYFLDYGERSAQPNSQIERVAQRYRQAEFVPSLYLELALHETDVEPHVRRRAFGQHEVVDAVSFTDEAGVRRSVFIHPTTQRVLGMERWVTDALFGDDRQVTEYRELVHHEGLLVPRVLQRRRLWFVEEELMFQPAGSTSPPPQLAAAPVREVRQPAVTIAQLAPRLFELTLDHLNNRCLFLVLDNSVALFEAPLTSETGELILAEIAAATGGKPVRWLFISHHHPDYVGGIRPFVARDTRLVTTPGNVPYLERIAAAKRSLEPDAQSRVGRPVRVEIVSGERMFDLEGEPVRVIDIGPQTQHTDEYLIYYFPRARALFEGDLIAPPVDGIRPAGERALGLLTVIDSLGLDVERIYEAWPLHGRAPFTTLQKLRDMVELRRSRESTLATP